MMIYRLTRAPERRIFYIDTGNLPTSKAEMFMERIKEKFKKEKFYNTPKGTVDARYNPMSMDEDYFVPTKNGKGTKIDTLPGATNLGEIEDVRYFRDKLLASLKIPKDYIVEKDKSPERKANLSQLDVKFARTIARVQQNIEVGLESIAKRHLVLKGYPPMLIQKLKVRLPEPSDMSAKRKLDLDQQKAQVIQAVVGLDLFSKEEILRQYYDFTDSEIKRIMEDKKKETEQNQQDQAAAAEGAPGAPGEEAGGGAPAEEGAPQQESLEHSIEKIKSMMIIDEEKQKILNRILQKQKGKADNKAPNTHI
jgi:hypothetical protein